MSAAAVCLCRPTHPINWEYIIKESDQGHNIGWQVMPI
jgi:hypothetical protein